MIWTLTENFRKVTTIRYTRRFFLIECTTYHSRKKWREKNIPSKRVSVDSPTGCGSEDRSWLIVLFRSDKYCEAAAIAATACCCECCCWKAEKSVEASTTPCSWLIASVSSSNPSDSASVESKAKQSGPPADPRLPEFNSSLEATPSERLDEAKPFCTLVQSTAVRIERAALAGTDSAIAAVDEEESLVLPPQLSNDESWMLL